MNQMHWLRKNWFQVAVLIVALIGIFLVALYETNQQNIQRQEHLDSLNTACQKMSNDKKKEIMSDTALVTDKFFRTFEYKYSEKADGCILAYVYDATENISIFGSDSPSPYREMEITNLTTGQVLFNEHPAPGNPSLEAYVAFNKLQDQYIASTTVSK